MELGRVDQARLGKVAYSALSPICHPPIFSLFYLQISTEGLALYSALGGL